MQNLEKHHKWPDEQTQSRAVFLNKDPDDIGNPMAYRILKITSTIYRVWAAVRMKNLEGWIKTWAEDNMFAGVPGVGAEDAWYLTSLDFEYLRAKGNQITAGSIDIYKCLDQLVRPLIYKLAEAAGMPMQILATYRSYLEQMMAIIPIL